MEAWINTIDVPHVWSYIFLSLTSLSSIRSLMKWDARNALFNTQDYRPILSECYTWICLTFYSPEICGWIALTIFCEKWAKEQERSICFMLCRYVLLRGTIHDIVFYCIHCRLQLDLHSLIGNCNQLCFNITDNPKVSLSEWNKGNYIFFCFCKELWLSLHLHFLTLVVILTKTYYWR